MGDTIFTVTRSTDQRLVQPKQTFCAAMGASSISQVATPAQANSGVSNLTFTIIPPSPQVMIQKCPLLDVTCTFKVTCLQSDGTGILGNSFVRCDPNYAPFAVWGRDIALAAPFPLGQLVSAYNITMNNAAVQQQNVSLPDLAHLLEGPHGRAGQATTCRTPLYASWDDAVNTLWGLSASTAELLGDGDVGPGAFNFEYVDDAGNPLSARGADTTTYYGGTGVNGATMTPNATCVRNGRPVSFPEGAGKIHAIYLKMRLIGPLMCSPFAFNYERSWEETGMYGLSAINVQAQLASASSVRLIQGCTAGGCILQGPNSNPWSTYTGTTTMQGLSGDLQSITSAKIWCTYLSPSVQSTLPPRSISTLCNLQYFQQTVPSTAVQNGKGTVSFSAVTFSNVPDLLMISVRPDPTTQDTSEANWCATFGDNAFQQFTFANQSGLFSGWTSYQLTAMSIKNGSKASIEQYGGPEGSGYIRSGGHAVWAGGSVLLIRPGVDFPLPTGVSVGSTGQVQLAFQLQFNAPRVVNFICTVTAISSGYWVTDNGVSRQLLVGLDEKTVLNAPESVDHFVSQRLAGGSFAHAVGLSAAHGSGFLDDAMERVRHSVAGAMHRNSEMSHTSIGSTRQYMGRGGSASSGGTAHSMAASLAQRLTD
jgi:hypothetical protein